MSEEAAQEVEEAVEDNSAEEQARAEGWVPEDEWKGDPDKWVSAEKFVERGEKILPLVKKKYDRAAAEVDALKAELSEVKKTAKEFKEFQNTLLENTKKRHAEQLASLKAERKQAAAEGDMATYAELDEKIDEMEHSAPADPPEPASEAKEPTAEELLEQMPAEQRQALEQWYDENQWYTTDFAMRGAADALAQQLQQENPTLRGKEMLDKLTDAVKKEFPHKFQNQKRSKQTVDGGSPSGTRKGGKGWDDLDPDAQAAFTKFQKLMPEYTLEQYLADYEQAGG